MAEGSAVTYVSRWLLAEMVAVSGSGEELEGVRLSYRPLQLTDFQADNGRIEAIYFGPIRDMDVTVRAFKGAGNIKYAEDGEREIVIVVVGQDNGDDASAIEERASNLLGALVKLVQASQPTSPGTHLENIRVWVDSWSGSIGHVAKGGTPVAAASFTVNIRVQSNVEQS